MLTANEHRRLHRRHCPRLIIVTVITVFVFLATVTVHIAAIVVKSIVITPHLPLLRHLHMHHHHHPPCDQNRLHCLRGCLRSHYFLHCHQHQQQHRQIRVDTTHTLKPRVTSRHAGEIVDGTHLLDLSGPFHRPLKGLWSVLGLT